MRVWMVFLCVFACFAVSWPNAAAADGPDESAAAALYNQAESDEASGNYASALTHYRDAYGQAPSGRFAQRALTRADFLRAHSEGNFEPFSRLERFRRDPALANDPAAIDALALDAEQFAAGPTRSEARMLVAEAYIGRLTRHGDGIAELRKVVADPKADVLVGRLAAREIVETEIADGDDAGARADAHAMANRLDPKLVKRTERLRQRRLLHLTAIVDLALTACLVGLAVVLAKRRGSLDAVGRTLARTWPVAVGFAGIVAIAGGALASSYESGNAAPFRAFGVALLPVLLAARAWGAAGSSTRAAKASRAILCASATLACAFVVLEAIDPTYLDGFGL
jgi:hypothetical protein